MTDALGGQKIYQYDAFGRMITVTEFFDGDPVMTTYTYNDAGGYLEIRDAQENSTFIYYDSLGRKKILIDPNMTAGWQYGYNSRGLLETQTDARGVVTTLLYDNLGRVTTKSFNIPSQSNIASTEPVNYDYDGGLLTSMQDGSGETVWEYDIAGRVLTETKAINGQMFVTQYSYDIFGRLATMTYPDGEVVTTTYNVAGQVTQMVGDDLYLANASYTLLGQPTLWALGNGVAQTILYDTNDDFFSFQPKEIDAMNGSGQKLQDLTVYYDLLGRLDWWQDNDVQNPYWLNQYYDDLSRIDAVTSSNPAFGQDFGYDLIGNLITRTGYINQVFNQGSFDRPHLPESDANGTTYTYDVNGNLVQREMQSGQVISYMYDAENRLTRVISNTLGANTEVRFVYDGNGQRVAQLILNGTTTLYLGDYMEVKIPIVDPTPSLLTGNELLENHTFDSGLNPWIPGGNSEWNEDLQVARLTPRETGFIYQVIENVPETGIYELSFGCKSPLEFLTGVVQYTLESSDGSLAKETGHSELYEPTRCPYWTWETKQWQMLIVAGQRYTLTIKSVGWQVGTIEVDNVYLVKIHEVEDIDTGLIENGDFLGPAGWIYSAQTELRLDIGSGNVMTRYGSVNLLAHSTIITQVFTVPDAGEHRFSFSCNNSSILTYTIESSVLPSPITNGWVPCQPTSSPMAQWYTRVFTLTFPAPGIYTLEISRHWNNGSLAQLDNIMITAVNEPPPIPIPVDSIVKRYYAGGQQVATRVGGELFYHLNDPSGTSLTITDAAADTAWQVVYDGYGAVLTGTMPVTLTQTLLDMPDGTTGLVHQGNGRYYDPALGRPLQPNPVGAPPTVPQALNRYAATPLGQPGVFQATASSYRSLTFVSLVGGFVKTDIFETAARSSTGVLGKMLISSAYHYSISIVQLTGSYSFVERSRGLIEAAGGDLLRTSLRVRSGKEGLAAIRQASLEFGFDSPDLASDVAVQLNRQGGWARLGQGVNVWSNIDLITESTRVPRLAILSEWYVGGPFDFLLSGAFQYIEDLQNPYFRPWQRVARVTLAGSGGFLAGVAGTAIGNSLGCGPYAPICIAGSGVMLGAIWAIGIQPRIIEAVPLLQPPPRNLLPLN